MNLNLYPLKLKPVLKDAIWGGTRLASEYKKSSDPSQIIAESWELAARKNGASIIENGEHAGLALDDLFALDKSMAYPGYKPDSFPLLVKFIDAAQKLSVQVHPGDAYAAKNEGDSGKSEMWYVVDAKPGAKIAYGLNRDCSSFELRRLIDEDRFEECLNYVEVAPGEAYFIPAGLVHAIGEGILILEIQQNSDATYRIYDYGRPRKLDIEKALDVCVKTRQSPAAPSPAPGHGILADCEYFQVEKFCDSSREFELFSMVCVVCIEGEGKIIHEDKVYGIKKGESYLLPSMTEKTGKTGKTGKCKIEGSAAFVAARPKAR